MRTPTIADAQYFPTEPPTDPQELPRYLRNEFQKIQSALQRAQDGHMPLTYVAPTKPREGDVRLADGVSWNPLGTGKAFVGYRGGAWVLLG